MSLLLGYKRTFDADFQLSDWKIVRLSIFRLADKDRGKCFGGVARLATAVNIDGEDHVEDDDAGKV